MADARGSGNPPGQVTNGHPTSQFSQYAGRWIACLGTQVVGQGGTPTQALQSARASRFKETPQVFYVSISQPLIFSPVFEQVRAALPSDQPVYLVGGAVRDALLGRPAYDLDFLLPQHALQTARRVANSLQAAYYPLDETRQYGRVVLQREGMERVVLDFAILQGGDLESDLRARDFTLNAMAVDVRQPQSLLDPLGGLADLRVRQLRACSAQSFVADPLRILRGIRLAAALDLRILPETRRLMRSSVLLLRLVSPERLRDELFRILNSPRPATSLRALEILGVLAVVLPELQALKGETQSPPHISDVWEHTLSVIQNMESLLNVLAPSHDPDLSANLHMGLVSMRLGRYRQQLHDHLQTALNPDRLSRALLFLAALYHDAGKPPTRHTDEDGRIRFFDHEKVSERIVGERAHALHLSNVEIERIRKIVRYHMRPLLLAQNDQLPNRRAIYRFFHQAGPAGVEVCLLSLADVLGTSGATLSQELWAHHLDVTRSLLEAWWERTEENISPPALITGGELMAEFGLESGPLIGNLLEALREAQACGQVSNREEAIEWVGNLLADQPAQPAGSA